MLASNVALARADFVSVNARSALSARNSIDEDKNSIYCGISHIRLGVENPTSNYHKEISTNTLRFKPKRFIKGYFTNLRRSQRH